MTSFEPFRALRPKPEAAPDIASLPYDVFTDDEARREVENRPLSFLRADKAESTMDVVEHERIPGRARDNFEKLLPFFVEEDPSCYLYRLTEGDMSQTGFAGCVSVSDYENGVIRKHEHTRPDKERDRIRHVEALQAHTGPILLAHKPDGTLSAIAGQVSRNIPLYDFVADDGVRHTIWKTSAEESEDIKRAFSGHVALYIADGHHRAAAAAAVAGTSASPEARRFLAVSFPSDELRILGYHRIVQDLPVSEDEFLDRLSRMFEVVPSAGAVEPAASGEFGMWLNGKWYRLRHLDASSSAKEGIDASILERHVLAPLLGINDSRTDGRIRFVGGTDAKTLAAVAESSGFVLAFCLHPTPLKSLMAVADAGEVMPPKSTWFHPKLRSGLLIHPF